MTLGGADNKAEVARRRARRRLSSASRDEGNDQEKTHDQQCMSGSKEFDGRVAEVKPPRKRRALDGSGKFPAHVADGFATQDVLKADDSAMNCGACLMALVENEDLATADVSQQLKISRPDTCPHFFHYECLKTWAARDTSCPQCRLRFTYIGTYDMLGQLKETKKCPTVFLADLLECEEEEDSEQESEVDMALMHTRAGTDRNTTPESALTRQRGRQRPSRRQIEMEQRRHKVEHKVLREVQRMRQMLTERRQRELSEQRAILTQIDPEKVKSAILRSLKQLPYQYTVDTRPLPPAISQEYQLPASEAPSDPQSAGGRIRVGLPAPGGLLPVPSRSAALGSSSMLERPAALGTDLTAALSLEAARQQEDSRNRTVSVTRFSAHKKAGLGLPFSERFKALAKPPSYQEDFLGKGTQ